MTHSGEVRTAGLSAAATDHRLMGEERPRTHSHRPRADGARVIVRFERHGSGSRSLVFRELQPGLPGAAT
jgi:hypothetical protein